MIIDAHTHIFPDNIAGRAIGKLQGNSNAAAYLDGSEAALLESMDAAGIDIAINLPVATNPLKVRKINELSAKRNSCQKRIFSTGCIHPDCEDVRGEMELVRELGLKAVKLHPYFQHHDFDDPAYLRILDIAGELGLIVVAHTGTDMGYPGLYRCTTGMIANVLRQAKGIKLVLAHMGGCGNWEDIETVIQDSTVYLDCAYSMGVICGRDGKPLAGAKKLLPPETFLHMVNAYGCERIMFGTDSPWQGQQNTIELMNVLELPERARERIMYKNALAFFSLSDWLQE